MWIFGLRCLLSFTVVFTLVMWLVKYGSDLKLLPPGLFNRTNLCKRLILKRSCFQNITVGNLPNPWQQIHDQLVVKKDSPKIMQGTYSNTCPLAGSNFNRDSLQLVVKVRSCSCHQGTLFCTQYKTGDVCLAIYKQVQN